MYQEKGSAHAAYADYGVGAGTVLAFLDTLPPYVKGTICRQLFHKHSTDESAD